MINLVMHVFATRCRLCKNVQSDLNAWHRVDCCAEDFCLFVSLFVTERIPLKNLGSVWKWRDRKIKSNLKLLCITVKFVHNSNVFYVSLTSYMCINFERLVWTIHCELGNDKHGLRMSEGGQTKHKQNYNTSFNVIRRTQILSGGVQRTGEESMTGFHRFKHWGTRKLQMGRSASRSKNGWSLSKSFSGRACHRKKNWWWRNMVRKSRK